MARKNARENKRRRRNTALWNLKANLQSAERFVENLGPLPSMSVYLNDARLDAKKFYFLTNVQTTNSEIHAQAHRRHELGAQIRREAAEDVERIQAEILTLEQRI